MTSKPTVSIIVAAYNAEATLRHCLESVLNHNRAKLELIVVDDRSYDQTSGIAQRFAAFDSRVSYIKNQGIKGASAARNLGLSHARGEYILFMDADDWMLAGAIDKLLDSAHRTEADLTIAAHVQYRGQDAQHLNNFGRKTETVYQGRGILDCLIEYLKRPYQNVMLVHCWGRLFKKALIDQHDIHFEVRLSQLEDLNFVFNYICHVQKITFVPQGLYFHRINNDGRSMSAQTGMEDQVPEKISHAFRALDKCLNTFSPGNAIAINACVAATTAGFMILTILRLSRAFIRQPGVAIYQRIKAIATSKLFHARLKFLHPKPDEAVVLYWACRTGSPTLVLLAGLLRTHYLRAKAHLPQVRFSRKVAGQGLLKSSPIFSTFRAFQSNK